MTQQRRLMVTLPADAYHALEQLAKREELPTERQASFLLKWLLLLASDSRQAVIDVGAAEGEQARGEDESAIRRAGHTAASR